MQTVAVISKLPRWAWIGAPVLTLAAGIINAVGFLGFQHQGITHLTGTTTLTGIAIGSGNMAGALHLGAIMGAFVAGATLSGFLVKDNTLQLGRRYGLALLIESLLLTMAVPLLKADYMSGDYLASAASGLQNAMASTFSGAVLRTTHVSGVFTDLGIFLGHLMRGLNVDWRRFRLWIALIASFLAGGIAGVVLFERLGYATLYVPGAITGVTGFAYTAYRHFKLTNGRIRAGVEK